MNTLLGLRVYVTPDVPKMQLSKDVPVSPDFRREIDAWLIELLGYTNILGDDAILMSEVMGTIHCNPRNYARLKNIGIAAQGASHG